MRRFIVGFVFGAVFACSAAHAHLAISSKATKNVTCANGICAPTASDAVLNVGDLETMLASGNVEVTTTGSGGIQATDIDIEAPFSWSAANTLTLDSYRWIFVDSLVQVEGQGGLTVITDDGGSGGNFCPRLKGRIRFANLSSAPTINGTSFTLVNSVKSLAAAIANNASGNYALADNYDAKQDGTYSSTPITTAATGNIQGFGNTISNIHVNVPKGGADGYAGGLFFAIDYPGGVENLALAALSITMAPYERSVSQDAAGLALLNEGTLFNDHVSGKISVDAKNSGADSLVGGLVAENYGGVIEKSSAATLIKAPGADPGGLAGQNLSGTIVESYATGSVASSVGYVGGFTTSNDEGTIENSYATGAIKKSVESTIGGFLALDASGSSTSSSYFSGSVTHDAYIVGGFLGQDYGGSYSDCYWDTTTSGTSNGTGNGNVSGINGLTTKQFKSGLPTGFDPTIWAEDPKINNGFPYLIANPPRD